MKNQSKRKWLGVVVLAGLAFLGFTGYRAQAASLEFSADMVSHSSSGTVSTRIYSVGEKMRTEMPEAIIITRMDKNVSWMIMPAEKMYMEQPIDRKSLPRTSKEVEGEVERESLGKDEVGGKSAEKFKVTYTEAGKRVAMYQWVATDSKFPVKMEAVDGSWSIEYKNLSLGPQPSSLFEPPPDYEKMSMPTLSGSGMPSMEEMMKQVE